MIKVLLSLVLTPTLVFALVGPGPGSSAPTSDRLPYAVDRTLAFRNVPVDPSGAPGAAGLALTRVELDPVSVPLSSRARDRAKADPAWVDGSEVVADGIYPALEQLLTTSLHAIPRQSLLLAPSTAHLSVRTVDDSLRVVGRATIDILSRTGISPARRDADGVGLQHFAIDRLGFELRWSSENAPRGGRRRALSLVDARKIAITTGRMVGEVDVRLSEAQRANIVNAIAKILDDERGPNQKLRAEVDLEHLGPRVFVHLLDLDYNEYGTYALAASLGANILEQASARPPEDTPEFVPPCVRWLSPLKDPFPTPP